MLSTNYTRPFALGEMEPQRGQFSAPNNLGRLHHTKHWSAAGIVRPFLCRFNSRSVSTTKRGSGSAVLTYLTSISQGGEHSTETKPALVKKSLRAMRLSELVTTATRRQCRFRDDSHWQHRKALVPFCSSKSLKTSAARFAPSARMGGYFTGRPMSEHAVAAKPA